MSQDQVGAFRELREANESSDADRIKAACVAAKRVPNLKDHEQLAREFEKAIAGLRAQANLPPGWDLERLLGDGTSDKMYGLIPVESGDKIALFQQLLDETRRSKVTRDRKEALAGHFEVTRVQEVQNFDTYQSYLKRREVVAKSCQGSSPPDAPIGDDQWTSWSGPVLTHPTAQKITRAFKLDELHAQSNEFLFFHGTKPTVEASIAEKNFDISYASKQGLFGAGLYFAEACTKSDEYVQCNSDQEYPLLLVRVTIGKPYYLSNDKPWEDPGRRQMEDSCKNGTYHSVLGDRIKCRGTYREFIVYDNDQAYPHFIVWYKRK